MFNMDSLKRLKKFSRIFKIVILVSSLIGLTIAIMLDEFWFFSISAFGPILASSFGLYECNKKIKSLNKK